MLCVHQDQVVQASKRKRHIQKKRIQINNYTWLKNAVKEEIADKEGLYQVNIIYPWHVSKRAHKQFGTVVNKVVRSRKRKNKINAVGIAKRNPEALYAYVNEGRLGRYNIATLQNSACAINTSYTDMSIIINDFFLEYSQIKM